MSLLYAKHPIVINPELAVAIGLNEAIVLQQLHYWLSDTTSGVMHEGRKWVYNTHEEWKEKSFDFYSVSTIKRTFSSLVKLGLIDVARLSEDNRDRTNFYTINYNNPLISGEVKLTQCNDSNCAAASGQNGSLQKVKLVPRKGSKRSVVHTETTTETTTDIKQISSSENSDEFTDVENIGESDIPARKGKWGTPEDLQCAEWIFTRIKRLYEQAAETDGEVTRPKDPNWNVWSNEIRLMRTIDGRTHRQICDMFQRIWGDRFWCDKVLSPAKLREKWDELALKLSLAQVTSTCSVSPASFADVDYNAGDLSGFRVVGGKK
ncbi:hypothetical protein MUU49_19485 [Scandinavium goeteborgense]|uniref:hypothetical protein n=1 Tax=Scandinavium goeteborgense TaxID=1851514 RepID=UPI002164FB42|nr:hypothetical protein [Scandinavium goeteborgense]MCS2154738.1 hypothetical protein [Scandinavium goeteborgense]